MPLTTLLVSFVIFLLGVAIGWRFNVGSVYVLLFLVLAFAALDYTAVTITLWPITHWVIVDLIAVQVGYIVGAVLECVVVERKARLRRDPG